MDLSDIGAMGSALIALIALIRPEMSALFRRWTNRLELYRAGRVEIGFSSFGGTIGLFGTLRAIAHDQFISSMTVTVVRKRDHLRHTFEWAAFRPVTIYDPQPVFQMATGFLVQVAQPHRFSIQFHDRETQELIADILAPLRESFRQYLEETKIVWRDLSEAEQRAFWTQFDKARPGVSSDVWAKLNRLFYWEAGEYDLELRVKTSRPDLSFPFKFRFELSDNDADRVRDNVILCEWNACGLSGLIFNFSEVRYLE